MKHLLKVVASLVLALMIFSFTTKEKIEKKVNTESSSVTWKAYKVLGSHTGNIKIRSGSLIFEDNVLTGGNFIIDMSTISVTDLEGASRKKLEGHLKSDDFFGVEKYTESSLKFTEVRPTGKNAYEVVGLIEIKGRKESISFPLSVYGNKANANLKIDRSKFDVRFGSTSFFDDLKDNAIYDEFDIIVDLEF